MRALALSLTTTLLAAQAIPDRPEKTAVPSLSFEAPKPAECRLKLKNGIPVFLMADATAQPMVTLGILVRGGSYLDPKGKEGLTAAWGAQLRQGGTQNLDAAKLDARLDYLAAQLNTFAGHDSAGLNLNLMAKDLKEGLALVQDLLTRPAFDQERLDLYKRNGLNRLEQMNDNPAGIEAYQLQFLTKGRDYHTSRWATAASLKSLSREDLLAQHARMLHPENLVISVGGRFDKTAVMKLLNETLGTLKAGPQARKNPEPPAPTHVPAPGIYVVHKEGAQSRVAFALPGLKRNDPDWVAVEVMNFLLGGDFTSRLTYLIRTQEGLSYHVNSRFTPGAWFPGDFRTVFQTKARSVAYGVRLALGELKRIQREPVSEAELGKAKGALMNGFPAAFASAEAVADRFATDAFQGFSETYYATYRDRVKAVTAADIQRVAKKYLPLDKLVILAVGDAQVMEAGDVKDHPGKLSEAAPLPLKQLPLWDPMTFTPMATAQGTK